MICELGTSGPRYSWCPQDPEGVDHYQLGLYLKETMGQEWGERWLCMLDSMASHATALGVDSASWLVEQICQYDAAELVKLLYPVMPELFLTPRKYPGRDEYPVRKGRLNALAWRAEMGSIRCLEALLELGADPNGLDCTTGGNWQSRVDGIGMFPVAPLDCAQVAEQEECCLLLELYGGVTVQRLCGRKESKMPRSDLRAMMNNGEELV